jgi:hypothetical protein
MLYSTIILIIAIIELIAYRVYIITCYDYVTDTALAQRQHNTMSLTRL